jgi:hypothetical protein
MPCILKETKQSMTPYNVTTAFPAFVTIYDILLPEHTTTKTKVYDKYQSKH